MDIVDRRHAERGSQWQTRDRALRRRYRPGRHCSLLGIARSRSVTLRGRATSGSVSSWSWSAVARASGVYPAMGGELANR